MKKLLSIVLVVVVAMGTMVFAFADTGVEEVVADEAVAFECPYGEDQGQRILNRYADGSGEGMKGNGLNNESGLEKGTGQGNRQNGAHEMNGEILRDGSGLGNGSQEMKGNGLRDGSGIEEERGQGNGHYGAQDGSGNGDRLRAGTEDCVNAE